MWTFNCVLYKPIVEIYETGLQAIEKNKCVLISCLEIGAKWQVS